MIFGIKFKFVYASYKPLLIWSLFASPVPRLGSLACILATVTITHFLKSITPTVRMGFRVLLPSQSLPFL